MAEQKWICSCGTENTGAFCSSCGSRKDGGSDASNDAIQQAMQIQLRMKQQEMAMEEERRKQQQEHDKACKEYEQARAKVPMGELKKLGRSWIVLVLAILVSVSALFTVISTVIGFSMGIFKILGNLIKLLLAGLVCAGFWKIYVESRKPEGEFNTGGIKMLRGVLTYNKVMMYLSMIGISILVIALFALLKGLTDSATGTIGSATGDDLSGVNMSITTILILGLAICAVVFAVQIVYYSAITKFANQAVDSYGNNRAPTQKVTLASVFFFIIGLFSLLGTIGYLVGIGIVNSMFDNIMSEISKDMPQEISGILGGVESLIGIDVFAIIADIVNASIYVLAGILALKFNKLNESIEAGLSKIPAPEFN